MVTQHPIAQLSGLAKRLVADGLLAAELAAEVQEKALKKRERFVGYLVENQLLESSAIAASACQEFGVPLFDLSVMDLEAAPISLVDEKLIRQHHTLPLFKRGNRLFVAVSDPTNLQALDEIKFHTGISTETILVEEDKLTKAIDQALDSADTSMTDLLDEDLDNLEVTAGDEDSLPDDKGDADIDDTPVVRFVNKVLLDAINKGASDIHIEPYEKTFRIRFRQDGVLHEVASPPVSMATRLVSRIKVMSRMDIAERRVPQDGRIKMALSKKRAIDFRVNTCPTLFGEKVVLRILDPTSAQLGIDMLGYEEHQKDLYMDALEQPQGMILVTGPTGSGKTVSLYTGLNILNTPERNISTAEDPVEINLEGINQCAINNKVGLTFAEALRSFLRQDPDIIMVGEIRDLETAEIAIKAAQTGHMVMSTLHTNSAAETITRLLNMGVPPFNLATSVNLIIAQRLARRLCKECKEPADIPAEALKKEGFTDEMIEQAELYKAVGCTKCASGYKGRVGVYEVVRITPSIARIIMEEGNSIEIAEKAREEGFNNLRMSGLRKAMFGDTSLEEINRVTTD